MTNDLETKLKDIPDRYFAVIAQLIAGHINNTKDFDHLNDPIIKPNIQSLYIIFVIQYAMLAIFGICSNIIIISYIVCLKLHKDVTQAFFVNLSICHVIQCLIVLPITLMVMLLQNWIFGQFLCYFLPILQDIPLHVAMISHILIAWDRMRWLGNPVKARLPAFVCCCATWLTGIIIALPYPIYTTYLQLGDYVHQLNGLGLCFVNLVDDMHQYMEGLFAIMYCGPTVLLAYLYIRTSRELRTPEGPFAVMMFEHRADIQNRQRNSSVDQTILRRNSYDLFSAKLDVTREKITQRYLGSMAATQVLCICPLMILRLAKMVMIETYDNALHFDLTYLTFIWAAFLPTVIFPYIYAKGILSKTEKERLCRYLRLASIRRDFQKNDSSPDTPTPPENLTNRKILQNISENSITSKVSKTNNIHLKQKISANSIQNHPTKFVAPVKFSNPLSNSCSNITTSSYCNNGIEQESTDLDENTSSSTSNGDKDPMYSKKWTHKNLRHLQKNKTFSGIDLFAGNEFSRTLKRDLEIIDLLERERRIDIQDMFEKHSEVLRRNSTQRRKLPEIEKVCKSPCFDSQKSERCFDYPSPIIPASRENSRTSLIYSNRSSLVSLNDLEPALIDRESRQMAIVESRFKQHSKGSSSSACSFIKSRDGNIKGLEIKTTAIFTDL